MSEFIDFGNVSFEANVDESGMGTPHASSIIIQLTDDNEWFEHIIEGYKEIIIRYHGEEHRFTPDEVLRTLYAMKAGNGG